jgi:hypothetical protein
VLAKNARTFITEETMTSNKELSTLFPGKGVDMPDGSQVTVTPLSLEVFPKIAEAFGKILEHAEKGHGNASIAARAASEISQLLPYCIDRPIKDVPLSHAPDIIDIVLEQNVTEEILGKWRSLVQKIVEFQAEAEKELSETKTKPSQD